MHILIIIKVYRPDKFLRHFNASFHSLGKKKVLCKVSDSYILNAFAGYIRHKIAFKKGLVLGDKILV